MARRSGLLITLLLLNGRHVTSMFRRRARHCTFVASGNRRTWTEGERQATPFARAPPTVYGIFTESSSDDSLRPLCSPARLPVKENDSPCIRSAPAPRLWP